MQDASFLTVVMRTQGNRTTTLRESLLCLSAQSSQDFEVCIVGHDLDDERRRAVEGIIARLHDDMRGRVRLVRVSGGSRATPLNAGFDAARGCYIAVFDDDDLLLGTWVEAFARLAEQAPGKLLRQVAVGQDWDLVSSAGGGTASRAVGAMKPVYAKGFDLLDHLVENRTPLHSLAFPRALFHEMHLRFDTCLTTLEDWDFLLRAAPLAGVVASPSIGCIYRHWRNLETSVATHAFDEWQSNYFHVLDKLDRMPLLLPEGSARRLCDMGIALAKRAEQPPENMKADERVLRLEQLRLRCNALLNSGLWRWIASMRAFGRVLRGKRQRAPLCVWRMTEAELEQEIVKIEQSRPWRLARRLGALGG